MKRFVKETQTHKNGWRPLDGAVILLAVVLSLLPFMPTVFGRGAAAKVRIEQHGTLLYTGSLFSDAVIETPNGSNAIEIKDGTVRMLHATCADGLCLAAGEATALRPIVCLPNEVTVTVIRDEEVGYDALTE